MDKLWKDQSQKPNKDVSRAKNAPDPDADVLHHNAEEGFTAQELIEQQECLEAQASEAIPYSVDKCTHSLGYLRQLVYACKTCGGGGVCVGCSVSCHADHELVELFHRRHFRCDCGTPNINQRFQNKQVRDLATDAMGPTFSPCTLREYERSKGWNLANKENTYTKNFEGKFCICERGKHYDPETEEEDMFQCLVCEEWYHESCTALVRPDRMKTRVLSQDQFDTMICDTCMRSSKGQLLRLYAGMPGWQVIVPKGTKECEVQVVGMSKRDESMPRVKRARLESGACTVPSEMHPDILRLQSCTHRMDMFLTTNFRDALCKCAACGMRWKELYPYVYEEEATYEAPQEYGRDDSDQDTHCAASSTYEQAVAALSRLPRTQMIESVYAYQNLRNALFEHLRPYAESHEPVSEEAVRAFFRGDAARNPHLPISR